MRIGMNFPNYSDDLLNKIVEQAPGKPFLDKTNSSEKLIGAVVWAGRVGDSTMISFEVELNHVETKGGETQNESV